MNKLTDAERENLEFLSDEIRHGHPVSMTDAIAAIGYQEGLRKNRQDKSLIRKLREWIWRVK